MKPTYTAQHLHYSSHHQTSCKESVISSLFNRACSINLHQWRWPNQGIARIKQQLKENGYQERIISKITISKRELIAITAYFNQKQM